MSKKMPLMLPKPFLDVCKHSFEHFSEIASGAIARKNKSAQNLK